MLEMIMIKVFLSQKKTRFIFVYINVNFLNNFMLLMLLIKNHKL
jgi:hypothetical protein